jgi:hypothetical protein
MSGTTSKIVPEINLDEFEKRLRAAGAPSTGIEDPLAELTRLVNAVHSDARRAARPTHSDEQAAPTEPSEEPERDPPPLFVSPLRPAFADAQGDLEPELEFGATPQASQTYAPIAAPARPPQRSRGWSLKIAGLGVLGLALLGGAWALKHGGVPGLAKAPPFIAADDAPTKVQPPNEATVQSSGDIAALLMKDSATPTPVKVVNNEEQPIDLRTQTQPAAPGAGPSPTPAMVGGLAVANAPDTPVVPPAPPSTSVAPMFPAAKPVKTVSVRPDGTLIAPDAAPVAPAPTTAPPAAPTPPAKSTARAIDTVLASPEAATPKLDLPTKLAPPKSPARVVAKTDTTAPADATDATPSAPLQLAAPRPVKSAKPATVADATPDDPAAPAAASGAAAPSDEPRAAGEGDWAVQLSAPRSEADAKSTIIRLKHKYAEALGDSELGVHPGDVKGETIYRVRVTGLSRAEAGALCVKLKASGGDCFVAKD